jgi:hypothetical protein
MGVFIASEFFSFQKCSVHTTQDECRQLCRTESIKKLCGCAPITFFKSFANAQYANCTFVDYEKCRKYLGKEDQQCRNDCLPSCTKWFYEIYAIGITDFYEDSSRITLFLPTFDFMIFEDAYSWTFEAFIGALGGVLGMWLGLDFSVLVEFLFNPMMAILKRILSKQGKKLNTTLCDQSNQRVM